MTKRVKNLVVCRATTSAGNPCKLHAVHGALVCHKHGAGAPQVKAKAAERIADANEVLKARLYELHESAIDAVRSVLEDPEAKAADKLKAADSVLNRFVATKAETKVTTSDTEERDLDDEILQAAGIDPASETG